MQASAVLHQDAHYLHANRIALIGARDKEIELLGLDTNRIINWEIHVRPDWKLSDDPNYSHQTSGTGWLSRSGMMTGVMIADDSIQPFADIRILEAHDKLRGGHSGGPAAEYVFLQRPRDWYVHRRGWRTPEPPRLSGSWRPIRALDIRFRLLRLKHVRDDDRTAQEHEQVELPGIEMAPISPCTDEVAFFVTAERLWFLLRILLVFRYRQFIYTLAEIKVGTGLHDTVWHNVRLEPRERDPAHMDPPFFGALEPYLAKGVMILGTMEDNRELLHAATYGYANSYKTGAMESGLTACVEAIERLVEAFEQTNNLTREVIERKRWKKLGRDVRRQGAPLAKTSAERDALDRALSGVPTMHLIERITRMVKTLNRKGRALPEELLRGAPGMIKARNDIVHGRLIGDHRALRIEILRAQVLFERLWLGFMNCGELDGSGWPLFTIRSYDAQQDSVEK